MYLVITMIKTKEVQKSKEFQAWISTRKVTEKSKGAIASRIKKYLVWRNLPLEELLKSTNELDYFEKYVDQFKTKTNGKMIYSFLSTVRAFLSFHGLKVGTIYRSREVWHFSEDEIMQQYIRLSRAKATKKFANKNLADYCNFRKKTPTELTQEETNEIELRNVLLDYRDYLLEQNSITEAYAWRKVNGIIRFYRRFKQIRVEFEQSEKPCIVKTIYAESREDMITKEEIQKLLNVADVRDKALILMFWESGLNPIDITNITYGKLKPFLNLDDPYNVPDFAVFKHIRQKYPIEHYIVISKQTLTYISLWLNHRATGLLSEQEIITKDSIIFSTKKTPYRKPYSSAFYHAAKNLSIRANIRKLVPKDFRDTFNTKLKKSGMDYLDREMLMGHSLGVSGHYEISDKEYYLEEYQKHWAVCFDLSYSNEKVKSLEEENREIKAALRNVSSVLENLYLALTDPAGKTTLTKEDLEKAISKIREIR